MASTASRCSGRSGREAASNTSAAGSPALRTSRGGTPNSEMPKKRGMPSHSGFGCLYHMAKDGGVLGAREFLRGCATISSHQGCCCPHASGVGWAASRRGRNQYAPLSAASSRSTRAAPSVGGTARRLYRSSSGTASHSARVSGRPSDARKSAARAERGESGGACGRRGAAMTSYAMVPKMLCSTARRTLLRSLAPLVDKRHARPCDAQLLVASAYVGDATAAPYGPCGRRCAPPVKPTTPSKQLLLTP